MKILIDINHPAHVHYFKNFIKIMENKGHQFLIISRNKEIEHYLLKKYDIPFVDRGKGQKRLIGKAIYYFKAVYLIFKNAKIFKPDVILSFGSPYAAIVSKLIGKPHIAFNDTEHAKLSHFLTDPFSKWILTPSCYKKDLGKKQIRFNGYMELCYLHPNYFTPDPSILDLIGVKKDEKYVIMRFVSWNASHDVGHSGLSLEIKHKAVKEFSKYAKVFISSEGELPEDLIQYQIKIPHEKMHDALYYSSLFFGESPTMTTESALLGVPGVCISSWAYKCGNFYNLRKYDLIECHTPEDDDIALASALTILTNKNSKKEWEIKVNKMLADKIDVTAFMVWFIENYPDSVRVMKKNPEYQNKFLSADYADFRRLKKG
jgi:predicted glycosyltransferase